MADDKIKYSDIIEPDDSIEKLVKQLSELNKSYEAVVDAIKVGAASIANSLKSTSGATNEGRKAIDKAAESTSRLERAQNELELALSDTGRQIAWLKAQTLDANKATVEHQRYLEQTKSSYDRLKSDLKQMTELYRSLTAAERADSKMGQKLLNDIVNLKSEIKAIDDQFKQHVQQLTEVEKAEQRLAYLQSDEGRRLLELKAKISAVTNARKQHNASIDPITQAQQKLAYAQSEENQQLKLYSTQIREANRIAQLQVQIANSAEGSYNRLAAQYELNKIKLNQMSGAEREAADSGKKLEAETNAMYQQMIKLQEATGNYRLSVGHYQRTWDGLGISISQVVRELPAAAVSLNTFFLGISNNVPMVVDEIARLRRENELLKARGEQTVSITGRIVRALFSWNTALVVLLTIFSMFGKEIIDWISNLFKAEKQVMSFKKQLEALTKELKKNTGGYGDNVVALKKLTSQWEKLTNGKQRLQWIKDNVSEFNKLGIAVNDVNSAEIAFTNGTPQILEALKLRARATAAMSLASQKYEEALQKNEEAILKERKPSTFFETTSDYFSAVGAGFTGPESDLSLETRLAKRRNQQREENIASLRRERDALEKEGDAFFDLADGYNTAADELVKALGLFGKARTVGDGRDPRDLTNIINRNNITIQKKYEESVTKLLKDEYAKRRKEAADQVQNENNKLREMYRLNEEYVTNVNGKYKELTKDQKKQIDDQQKLITKTIANNLRALDLQLQQIQNEQKVASLQTQRNTINPTDTSATTQAVQNQESTVTTNVVVTRDASQMEASLVEERRLMEENLDIEYALILDTNKKLLAAGNDQARSEEEILIELNKRKLKLWSEYDQQILEARQTDIEAQLKLVQKGSKDELNLLLQQNEIARQLALAKNAAAPAAQQQSTSVINAQFNRTGAQIQGQFEMAGFEQQQELDEAIFNEVERSEREITRFKLQQEKERWEKQITLAESGGLNWSQAQIDAAKATVIGINRELSELDDFINNIGKKGLGNTLLENLGFNDDQIDALSDAVNTVIENLQSILDAEVELAEQAVEAAEKRVEAAQKAYDAEVEARNNGYANNVATAKKELEQEKKNQLQKQKQLEAAQKRQAALQSTMQSVSLITASANLWSAFSSVPIIGPALALSAIAMMWTSFAAAKIKANQVTANAASEEYGEGGLEFLDGGSHASGNDIDLKTKNKKGKNMKAEGGEALAIINKRSTRKYKKILPDVIESFNKGVFENKYLNAFANSDKLNIEFNSNSTNIDLSKIENDVMHIRKQNEVKYYVLKDGTTIMQYRNVKRIIKN
jgi:hypothetical protein